MTGPRTPHQTATTLAEAAVELLSAGGGPRVVIAGSWRRQCATVGDLDVMVVTDEPLSSLGWPLEATEHKASGRIVLDGAAMTLDIWRCPTDAIGPFACFLTGPAGLNVDMRIRAKKRGMKLSQYGVFDRATDERLDAPSCAGGELLGCEQRVYEVLGLPMLAPTERDDWSNR